MGTIVKLVINKVDKTNPPKSGTSKTTGKPYTVYSWVVSGTVNGEARTGFGISTMSDAVTKQVVAGAGFDAEESEYNGVISYKLSAPKPAFGGGSGGGRTYTPPEKYTKEELEALYGWGVEVSARVLGIDISNTDSATLQVIQNGAATLVIAAQKCGLKV